MHHGADPERATPLTATRYDRFIPPPSHQRGASGPPVPRHSAVPLAMARGTADGVREPVLPQGGTVASSTGAAPPVSAGGCHGLMRPQEVAHLVDRLGEQV